ncbi:hypothetical protein AYO20_00244 [Fonsecaea nubica]|uniref:Enoyl reductase (ER) domain-containing protein n=1 Tax=Fonsecaea nubica TaxID=856822 RepID=A0A178DER7_9EURO|nr:hypothetical protein AYO20_00244 [Fonsecaea nubica]OAL40508.1 hypothetical protein AYO20_00244 [Fonsecaea nubica]
MKAYQFETVEEGLCLKDVPVPKPPLGEVLIVVEAAGICHSDGHALKGQGDWLGKLPITLGHEAAGTVAELGPGVTDFKIGDRVGVALLPTDSGDWSHIIGVGRDGSYAEKALIPAHSLVHLPEKVSFPAAAVANDSISTAYHAIVAEAKVTASTTVAIVGLGGLGLNAVRIASLQGATIYGVDIDEKKFGDASSLGATACYQRLADIPSDIVLDVVVDFAGVGVTTQDAMLRVKPSGTVVMVGLGVASFELSTHVLLLRNITLRGSRGATKDEYVEVLRLIAAGEIVPKLEEVPFSDVPAGLQRLEQLGVVGRLFTRPNA